MLYRIVVITALTLSLALPVFADSDRDQDMSRIHHSAQVFQEIMSAPDKAIPQNLLESAKCVVIIPSEEKAAFFVGERHGKGVATCRTQHGWSSPLFVAVGGGSFGLQFGASSTDIVMLFMNDHALQSLLSDKFKIGGDVAAAAGPVGRHAAAGTDVKLNAEILTYARSKGVFAGVSLDGAVVQADHSGDQAMYGRDVQRKQILDGGVSVPKVALPLTNEISRYAKA